MCVGMKLFCTFMMFISRLIRTKFFFFSYAKNNELLFSSYINHHVRSKHGSYMTILKQIAIFDQTMIAH